jgi:hypothetical protein
MVTEPLQEEFAAAVAWVASAEPKARFDVALV